MRKNQHLFSLHIFSLHTVTSALRSWAIEAFHALNPFPTLPVVPCPLDGTGICTAVIRGSGAKHSSTAALAYTDPAGESHLELFRKNHSEELIYQNTTSARLDALERLLQNPTMARTTRLFIDDPTLRAEVAATIDSFPGLELSNTAPHTLSNTASQAISRTQSTTIKNTPIPLPTPINGRRLGGSTHLVIATDASIIPGKPGVGIASITADGEIWQDHLPDTCDIDWAEMKAIHAAIAGSIHHPHVIVLSDSQHAIAYANGTVIPTQRRMRNLAHQIQALRAGRDVNIDWVRAHRGHPLNEAADTLARQARHHHITTPTIAVAA